MILQVTVVLGVPYSTCAILHSVILICIRIRIDDGNLFVLSRKNNLTHLEGYELHLECSLIVFLIIKY